MELERARNRAGLGLWAGKTWAHSSLDGTDWAHCEGDVEGVGSFFVLGSSFSSSFISSLIEKHFACSY